MGVICAMFLESLIWGDRVFMWGLYVQCFWRVANICRVFKLNVSLQLFQSGQYNFQYLRSNLDQSFSKLSVSFGFMSYDNILTGKNRKVKFQDKEEIFQNKEITIDKLYCKVDTVTKSLSAQKHPTRLAVSTQFYEVFLLW